LRALLFARAFRFFGCAVFGFLNRDAKKAVPSKKSVDRAVRGVLQPTVTH
jgi:hypothetical protein